jgi:putative hydrolase of the HAD superfamily
MTGTDLKAGARKQSMLKGVLFDLGSTLQEYEHEDWDGIVREMNHGLYARLTERGYAGRLPPLDAFLELLQTGMVKRRAEAAQTLHSFSMMDVLEQIMADHGIEDDDKTAYLAPWYEHLIGLIYIRPDVEPTLRLLRDGGLKLGLVSNTVWPASVHDPDLERFGIKELLDCRLYSCEVGWEKPAPQIFKEALDCMGLRPEETAFVGDFLRYDVAGAQRAGMRGIWKRVQGRPRDIDDYDEVVPDATITTLGELPDTLRSLYGWKQT